MDGGMVRRLNTPIARVLPLLVLFFSAIPSVLARESSAVRTGLSPLNKVVGVMAWMFNVPILENPMVQLGFTKFLLFVLFLAVSRYAFKKAKFDNKTAGIIATVFALIAAFLMPSSLVMANGGVITVVLTGLIPLGIIGGALYFCVNRLDKDFVTRLIAIVILFTLLMIVEVYHNIINAATQVGPVAGTAVSILQVMLDWLDIAIIMIIIYMLVRLFTNGKGLGNLFKGGDGDRDTSGKKKNKKGDDGTSDGGDGGDGKGDKGKKKKGDDDDDDSIDFANLGQIRFLIRNLNDEPVENAKVSIYPAKAKKFLKKHGKKGRHYTGTSNMDGICPSHGGYLEVPSGTLRYNITYKLRRKEKYKKTKLFGRSMNVKSDVEIQAGQPTDVDIVLEFYSEKQEGFEPHIEYVGEKDEQGKREYKGIIKPL